jgi:hypothetical protein
MTIHTGKWTIISVAMLLSIACAPTQRPHTQVSPGAVVAGHDVKTQGGCVVKLASPESHARLRQIRRSDDTVEIVWEFAWRDCPVASKYHLYVKGPQATNPLIDDDTLTHATYVFRRSGYGIPHRKGWTWMVRAYADGRWSDWSEQRSFDVARPTQPRRVAQ